MKRITLLFAVLLFCCALAAPAGAQMGMRGPELQGVFHPVVGAGAEYGVEMQGQPKTTMEIAIVGKEQVSGKDGYWMEMGMANPEMGGTMYIKSLSVVDNGNIVVTRVLMQMPNGNVMEMPMQGAQRRPPQSADITKEMERVGSETLSTPAGTFACVHWRQKDGSSDIWISEKVFPWGAVKLVSKNMTMTLQRLITDAKTHVTGTPTKFDPMNMMRQHQQPE
jgi:hypothetical protein